MTGSEKILAIVIAVCLAVIITLGWKVSSLAGKLGTIELSNVENRNEIIAEYDGHIEDLNDKILELEEEYEKLKRMDSDPIPPAIAEYDSVSDLTYDESRLFFITEINKLDSLWKSGKTLRISRGDIK
jgi:hypothetical protein